MNSKIIITSILPIISISSGIILNYHLNNKISKNTSINSNANIKEQLSNNKKIHNNKRNKDSFIAHKSIDNCNIKKLNTNKKLSYKNISIVLNHSFNKHLIFAPYIYHFHYKQYKKNKNDVYQLVSCDTKIWTHSKTVHVAYPFLNSTYVQIVGVRGNKNNLQINQNFKLSVNELKNVSKNTLKINVDAIGIVSNPHIYLNYHYKLKNENKINLINKKYNLNKNKLNENNDDYFDKNLTNLRSHFNNYQIKMFGYYKVFNLNLSAKSWFTHNLINALLILLPIAIDIFANMFCGIVSGLIMSSITSQIKNFIISLNLNLIDSTLTKGYLGYAYMAGDTLFTMGESEMEFIASGVGDFFVTGKSIHGMNKAFSDEQSKTEAIEYAGDDDMREKLDDSRNISVSTNQSFAYSHNDLEQGANNNNNIQSSLDNQAQNSHSNMNASTQASDHNENSNLIMLEGSNNILINNNDEQPVVTEENSYDQYYSQLIINHYSSRIIQEEPYRGIDDDSSDSDNESSSENYNDVENLTVQPFLSNADKKIEEMTNKEEAAERNMLIPHEDDPDEIDQLFISKIFGADSILTSDVCSLKSQRKKEAAFLMPYMSKLKYDDLQLVDIETGLVADNIEELMKLKINPTLMDRIRYFEYFVSKIERTDILQKYNSPSEINYDELALKQIKNENTGAINYFKIPFSEDTIKYTRQELFKPWKDSSLIDYLLSKDVFKFDFQKFIQLSSLDYMEKHVDYSEAKVFLYRVKWTNITIYFEWIKSFGNEEKIIELLLHPDYEIRRQLFSAFKEDYSSQRQVIPNESDFHIVDENKLKFMSLNYFYYLIILHSDYSLEFYNLVCSDEHEFQNAHYNFTFMSIFWEDLDTKLIHESQNLKFEKLSPHIKLIDKIKNLKHIKNETEGSILLENYDSPIEIDYFELALRQLRDDTTSEEVKWVRYHEEEDFNNPFSMSIIEYTKKKIFSPWKKASLIDYLLSEEEFSMDKFFQSFSFEYMKEYIEFSEAKLFLYRMKLNSMSVLYDTWEYDFENDAKIIKILLDEGYSIRSQLVLGPVEGAHGFRPAIWEDKSSIKSTHSKRLYQMRAFQLENMYYLITTYKDYSLEFQGSVVVASWELEEIYKPSN